MKYPNEQKHYFATQDQGPMLQDYCPMVISLYSSKILLKN